MRQVFTLLGLLVCLYTTAQTKKNIDSKIEKVTVFLEGAQVQRSAKTNLTAGKYELVFTNISPSIDKQSIQVKADDKVTVLSVIHQQNFLKEQQKQEEIKDLEAQKETQVEKIALQRNIVNVFKQEENMLVKNQLIGGNDGVKATDLKEAADFQRSRLTEVYQKQMETDRAIKKMEAELLKINKQLYEINQKAETSTSEIHVTLSTKETNNSSFTITYLVKKSGWFPTYDIRVKDISSPINLQYKANIFQSSGEDWKDVKLFLSTGNPNENGTKPVISPWYLKYTYAYQPVTNTIQGSYSPGSVRGRVVNERGEPVVGASIVVKGTRTGTVTDANGFYSIQVPTGNTTIVASSVGMEAMELAATQSGLMNINMKESETALSEVVVTGYALQGKVAGVQVTNDYENQPIRIRGVSSIKNNKEAYRDQNLITTITYQPTTTIYEIKDPYTILNDGKTYMADIDGYEVKAQYEYYAAPKIEADAVLTAKIVDWQELNLLPGEANLFFEGTFLGKSLLDVENAGDTLSLSLGKDKGVAIKKNPVKRLQFQAIYWQQ
ncbi:MAG: mucoidy inhibitor MuiA family protein [Chitinophagaceae bacterium]|nr:mucoidy inhibitor MuiA family protein [Chitinophagaceae bacterium]